MTVSSPAFGGWAPLAGVWDSSHMSPRGKGKAKAAAKTAAEAKASPAPRVKAKAKAAASNKREFPELEAAIVPAERPSEDHDDEAEVEIIDDEDGAPSRGQRYIFGRDFATLPQHVPY